MGVVDDLLNIIMITNTNIDIVTARTKNTGAVLDIVQVFSIIVGTVAHSLSSEKYEYLMSGTTY